MHNLPMPASWLDCRKAKAPGGMTEGFYRNCEKLVRLHLGEDDDEGEQ
jgi:hypothetical protein